MIAQKFHAGSWMHQSTTFKILKKSKKSGEEYRLFPDPTLGWERTRMHAMLHPSMNLLPA